MANGNGQTVITKLVQVIGPVVLGMLGAWGTIQYKEGAREQRILALEREVKELREQSITRHEMAQFMESTTEGIQGIRADIRELRNKR